MGNETAQTSYVDGYASAMLGIATVEGDEIADEIFNAAIALNGNAELIDVLADNRIPAERKQGIIDDLLGQRASIVTSTSWSLLARHGVSMRSPSGLHISQLRLRAKWSLKYELLWISMPIRSIGSPLLCPKRQASGSR